MMTPEQTIAAFLEVWKNHPDFFLVSDIEADLDNLNQSISSDQSNEDIAKLIQNWCKNHPIIRDAVLAASRKPKPRKSEDTSLGNVLDNRYPELSKVLREKIEKSEQK
ncbi:conserved hypothetical protein [Planktothrix serta PCC 8927]|uniref:Uncharacterized protein n=1 Tax=Planktothrix serta PCC 8927 TaxID=671068 RepID=A0A7Z9DZE5_9CYAN|nr:hypothetical protein [Planktothrix serta]VXD19967.1 conserved hypothetical protein [Planktothrix serta PCC 8927]